MAQLLFFGLFLLDCQEDEKSGDYYGWTATMDLGPIKYKGALWGNFW